MTSFTNFGIRTIYVHLQYITCIYNLRKAAQSTHDRHALSTKQVAKRVDDKSKCPKSYQTTIIFSILLLFLFHVMGFTKFHNRYPRSVRPRKKCPQSAQSLKSLSKHGLKKII